MGTVTDALLRYSDQEIRGVPQRSITDVLPSHAGRLDPVISGVRLGL